MKKISKENVEELQRIQAVLLKHGYEATLFECQQLWQKASDDWSAGWLCLPTDAIGCVHDGKLWEILEDFVDKCLIL